MENIGSAAFVPSDDKLTLESYMTLDWNLVPPLFNCEVLCNLVILSK